MTGEGGSSQQVPLELRPEGGNEQARGRRASARDPEAGGGLVSLRN